MIWTKYVIKTTTKDADIISAILMDYDITDIQIENNIQLTDDELNAMYADYALDLPEDDGSCTIDFYMEFDEDEEKRKETQAKLEELKQDLKDAEKTYGIEPVGFESLEVDSEDWENNWKAYFKPFAVEDILIRPTWEERPEGMEDKIEVVIDPGMAFGTGTHETTRLCLKAINSYLKPGDDFSDLGCGSGILGIAAVKLGARRAIEADIDARAAEIAEENFAVNNIPREKASFYTGDILKDETVKQVLAENKADLACANIMAEVLALMMPELSNYIKDGGILVMSGILNEREEMIKKAVSENSAFKYMKTIADGDWCAVYVKKIG